MSLFQIYEGWKNKLIPAADMKEKIATVSNMRMEICQNCPDYSENKKKLSGGLHKLRPDIHCTRCGCTLSAKTKCLSCNCPLEKWGALMKDEQYDEILNELKNEQEVSQ
jgi:hypothetical protein